jgi:hypothetical protein
MTDGLSLDMLATQPIARIGEPRRSDGHAAVHPPGCDVLHGPRVRDRWRHGRRVGRRLGVFNLVGVDRTTPCAAEIAMVVERFEAVHGSPDSD